MRVITAVSSTFCCSPATTDSRFSFSDFLNERTSPDESCIDLWCLDTSGYLGITVDNFIWRLAPHLLNWKVVWRLQRWNGLTSMKFTTPSDPSFGQILHLSCSKAFDSGEHSTGPITLGAGYLDFSFCNTYLSITIWTEFPFFNIGMTCIDLWHLPKLHTFANSEASPNVVWSPLLDKSSITSAHGKLNILITNPSGELVTKFSSCLWRWLAKQRRSSLYTRPFSQTWSPKARW